MGDDWNQLIKHESLHKCPASELEFANAQMVLTHMTYYVPTSACDHTLKSVYFRALKHIE